MLSQEAQVLIDKHKRPLPKKRGCGSSLQEDVIKSIINDLCSGMSQRNTASKNNVSTTTVNRIAKRLRETE